MLEKGLKKFGKMFWKKVWKKHPSQFLERNYVFSRWAKKNIAKTYEPHFWPQFQKTTIQILPHWFFPGSTLKNTILCSKMRYVGKSPDFFRVAEKNRAPKIFLLSFYAEISSLTKISKTNYITVSPLKFYKHVGIVLTSPESCPRQPQKTKF